MIDRLEENAHPDEPRVEIQVEPGKALGRLIGEHAESACRGVWCDSAGSGCVNRISNSKLLSGPAESDKTYRREGIGRACAARDLGAALAEMIILGHKSK